MGGSGGFGGYRSIGMGAQLSSSTSGAQASQREIEMNKFLEDLLKEYNSRDVEAIRTHLNEIEKVLGREIEGLDRILFGGSISKHTFIEGTSDVDALVILDNAIHKDATPKELQTAFAQMLRQRFPNTEIKCGTLSVTVKFSNYEIQLLPAMKNNGKLQIASSDGSHWSSLINSAKFTERLTATNRYLDIHFPVARSTEKIIVREDDDLDAIINCGFDKYRGISDYEAIWSKELKCIECEIQDARFSGPGRFLMKTLSSFLK